MPIELKTKQGNITLTAPKTSGGTVDLSNYYTKAQTDEKIEEAVANIDIPEVDLTGYAKIEDIPDVSEFITEEDIPDTSNFATKDEIPDVSGFATKEEIPDTSNLATKDDIPDISGLQTEAQVIALITDALTEIGVAEEGAY